VLIALVLGQLVLDVVLVLMVIRVARRRPRARPDHAPPAWYQEFLRLAEDLLAITEPVLAALESPAPAPTPVAPAPAAAAPVDGPSPEARYRLAFSLLRAGGRPEEVARRGALLPRELRLIESLVAAESRLSSRGT
jgi:hypothetical protein